MTQTKVASNTLQKLLRTGLRKTTNTYNKVILASKLCESQIIQASDAAEQPLSTEVPPAELFLFWTLRHKTNLFTVSYIECWDVPAEP